MRRIIVACAALVCCLGAYASALQTQDIPTVRMSSGLAASHILENVISGLCALPPPGGSVVSSVLIDEKGDVTEAKAISGPLARRAPVEQALLHWKYRPFEQNGKAVRVRTTITIIVDCGC